MKKIYIIRHAKSSWSDSSLTDFDRPLNKRGERDSKFMGELLHKKEIRPDSIISSPANRAKTTALNIAKMIEFPQEDIVFQESIYEASLQTLLYTIRTFDNAWHLIFLVGHNPSLSLLVEYLSPKSQIIHMPTTGIVELDFHNENWETLAPEKISFVSFEYPKRYFK